MNRGFGIIGLYLVACFPPGDGRAPPSDAIYFPVGLALSSSAERLYVANSDFDLQYNGGTLLALDAARIRQLLPSDCSTDADCAEGYVCDNPTRKDAAERAAASFWCVKPTESTACAELGEKSAADRLLQPGLCGAVDLVDPPGGDKVLLDSVLISAFATDVVYRENPVRDAGRLFVPVRGDATLHWLDVEGGAASAGVYTDALDQRRYLDCGQEAGSQCDANHRRGDEEINGEAKALPVEPFAVAVSGDGEAVVTTHQTTGQLALFVNDWCAEKQGPVLKDVISDLSLQPVAIAAVPVPKSVASPLLTDCDAAAARRPSSYQPGFLVGFRSSPDLQLVRYFDAATAAPAEPLLEATESTRVSLVSGLDARGIAVDASARETCEAECAGSPSCLMACSSLPLGVFIANRFPAALISGETTPTLGEFARNDVPNMNAVEALRGGPSRVIVGDVIDLDGKPATRVFVVTFDTRLVYIYDPIAREIEATVSTGRGPHALAIDGANGIGYVGHFTDSYIGVIDLDRRHHHYGEIILTLGKPSAPRASQ